MNKPILLNLFGGPGAGKSTTAAMLYAYYKQKGKRAELILEYAKEIAWEAPHKLKCPYTQSVIQGKQLERYIPYLKAPIEILITDSPLLLSSIYSSSFKASGLYIDALFNKDFRVFNLMIQADRDEFYDTKGRYQSVEEANLVDVQVASFLKDNNIHFYTVAKGDIQSILNLINGE